MELRAYWAVVMRRWWLPVGLALLVAAITLIVQRPWQPRPVGYNVSMRFNVGIQPERIPVSTPMIATTRCSHQSIWWTTWVKSCAARHLQARSVNGWPIRGLRCPPVRSAPARSRASCTVS